MKRSDLDTAFKPRGEIGEIWRRNLHLARSAAQMDRSTLANKAGMDASEITRLENGDRTPSDTTKCLLARALSIPVEDLFPFPSIDRIARYLGEAA